MKVISTNKEAYFNYHVIESYHAGIVLTGDEVKSIRRGDGGIKDAFVTIHNGQAQVINWNITPYSHAYSKDSTQNSNARRSRTLLLSRKQIDEIEGSLSRKGLTAVALKLYFSEKNFIKLEIGVAKHKKLVDKRDKIKERDLDREVKRELKNRAI